MDWERELHPRRSTYGTVLLMVVILSPIHLLFLLYVHGIHPELSFLVTLGAFVTSSVVYLVRNKWMVRVEDDFKQVARIARNSLVAPFSFRVLELALGEISTWNDLRVVCFLDLLAMSLSAIFVFRRIHKVQASQG